MMDMDTYLRFVAALVFVLVLIVAAAWLVRRLGLAGARPIVRGSRGRRRLALVEVLPVDAKRRLVLVRRDGVEHLVLLGTTADLVVETGINPPFEEAVAAAEAAGEPEGQA